jgi:uncharacterized protein
VLGAHRRSEHSHRIDHGGRRCRFASYCGGGCAVLAEGKTGTIHSNHCDGFAKRFRHSAAQAYAEHVSGAVPARDTDRVCDL